MNYIFRTLADYPFKPPTIKFITPIYHPNVDEKGGVCLPLVLPDNWKPAVKVEQVLQSLVALVNDPEPDHALRADLAEGKLINFHGCHDHLHTHIHFPFQFTFRI